MPGFVERQLQAVETLTTQINAASKETKEEAERDEVCRRLMSVPGVGTTTAVRFVATLDTPSRFGDAHHVESYVGLVPSEMSSSDRQRRGSITKAGNGAMRWLLVQAAWSLWRTQPHDPMVRWARRIAERRGRGVAVVALARKLGGVMFAMWRDGTRYSPKLAARAIPSKED